jgi:FtsP/CotA-like multicopper oxidase with cupredoxin domain
VVEYAGKSGAPQWQAPVNPGRGRLDEFGWVGPWDYAMFSQDRPAAEPDHKFDMLIRKVPGNKKDFNRWTINGKSFPEIEKLPLENGKRYRLFFNNDTPDMHPLHLHRHTFEIAEISGRPMSGVMKDVISVGHRGTAAVDFVANNPGLTLFHCHMQSHMDFGFMQLLEYM